MDPKTEAKYSMMAWHMFCKLFLWFYKYFFLNNPFYENQSVIAWSSNLIGVLTLCQKNGKTKVQGMPQSQSAALPRHQEEEETDKTKQSQIEQTYEKH